MFLILSHPVFNICCGNFGRLGHNPKLLSEEMRKESWLAVSTVLAWLWVGKMKKGSIGRRESGLIIVLEITIHR